MSGQLFISKISVTIVIIFQHNYSTLQNNSQGSKISLVMISMNNFSCGERIKELRLERSLSQERLALNAGIAPAYLGLVERGKRNATVATIECICYALNISLAEFFSPATDCPPLEDTLGKQILHQLVGLSDEEKQVVLQLVKYAVHLRQLNV